MEYIADAARLTDAERIQDSMHLNVERIMYDVCDVLGKQIFRWGLVNADPHVRICPGLLYFISSDDEYSRQTCSSESIL